MSLGDDLLVYLLTMAVSHVRKKSNVLREAAERGSGAPKPLPPRSAQVYDFAGGPTETILTRVFTSLCQFRNEGDRDGAKRRVADSQEGAY